MGQILLVSPVLFGMNRRLLSSFMQSHTWKFQSRAGKFQSRTWNFLLRAWKLHVWHRYLSSHSIPNFKVQIWWHPLQYQLILGGYWYLCLVYHVSKEGTFEDLVLDDNAGEVDGIAQGLKIRGKGTFILKIEDNDGRVHTIQIKDSLCVPTSKIPFYVPNTGHR